MRRAAGGSCGMQRCGVAEVKVKCLGLQGLVCCAALCCKAEAALVSQGHGERRAFSQLFFYSVKSAK